MLVLMLEVQKGYNGDVDTCISVIQNYSFIQTPQHNLQTNEAWITEDALYYL